MIQTFEEFKNFYKKNKYLPNDVGRRKNPLNEKQLKTRYNKYLKQQDLVNKKQIEAIQKKKQYYTIDERWEEVKRNMDLSECLLMKRLKDMKFESLYYTLSKKPFIDTIDPAHVFPRSGFPHLKYEPLNIVPLNRYSHSNIDQFRDPIFGDPITKEVQTALWEFILGKEKYKKLKKLAYKEGE